MDVSFSQLYQASKQRRQGKAKGSQCQGYEANLLKNLFDTQAALQSYTWHPLPMRKFVAVNGSKPREIHSPAYADRVLHHWVSSFSAQCLWFVIQYPNCKVYVQKGRQFVDAQNPRDSDALGQLFSVLVSLKKQRINYAWVAENGYCRRLKHRQLTQLFIPQCIAKTMANELFSTTRPGYH